MLQYITYHQKLQVTFDYDKSIKIIEMSSRLVDPPVCEHGVHHFSTYTNQTITIRKVNTKRGVGVRSFILGLVTNMCILKGRITLIYL